MKVVLFYQENRYYCRTALQEAITLKEAYKDVLQKVTKVLNKFY